MTYSYFGEIHDIKLESMRLSSSLFSILMLNYFIEKVHHQNDRNGQPLTLYIELCMKSMEVGLGLAFQKYN